MSDYATRNDLKELQKDIKQDISEVLQVMQAFMHQVDERFNKVKKEIASLRTSHERLINTIDGFVARVDHYKLKMLRVATNLKSS